VATVVLKLLNLAQPEVAYFGQKDFQQARVIEQMVHDLDVPVTIRVCPIVREADGLAMSSRNAYLSREARLRAAVLAQSLELAGNMVAEGRRDAAKIAAAMRRHIETAEGAQIEYAVLVDPKTLEPIEQVSGPTLAVLAVRIEETRLIDNQLLYPPGCSAESAGSPL
jgi:pantoate--beta-alanine ligase